MYALLSVVQMHPVTSQRPCKEPSQGAKLIAVGTASLDFPPLHTQKEDSNKPGQTLELGAKISKKPNAKNNHKEKKCRN